MNPKIKEALDILKVEISRLEALQIPDDVIDEVVNHISRSSENILDIYFNFSEDDLDAEDETES